jgi:Outer membrane lipoprotein-sorting protein
MNRSKIGCNNLLYKCFLLPYFILTNYNLIEYSYNTLVDAYFFVANKSHHYNTTQFIMKKIILGICLLFSALVSQAQTADEIIAKHVAATGGSAWDKLKTIKMDMSMTSQAAPGMAIPMSMTVVHKKAMRMDVSLMGMTQSSCINGDKGWANNPFQGQMDAEPLTADQVKEMKEQTDLAGHLNGYKEKGYTAEYIGKEDVEGTELHKIKLTLSPTHTQYSLIDPESFMEVKQISVVTVDGKEVTSESVMSDYKTIEGITMPYTIEQNNPMMGATVMKVTKLEINPSVDEKIFEMPAKK